MTVKQLSEKYKKVIQRIEKRKRKLLKLMNQHIQLRLKNKKIPNKLIKNIQDFTHRSVMNKNTLSVNRGYKKLGNSWVCNRCN